MPHDIQVAPTTSLWLFSAGCSRFLSAFLGFSVLLCAQQSATLTVRPVDSKQLQQSFNNGQEQKITIVVEDAAGSPVPQAAVSFRLPEEEPTGRFANELRSEVVITGPDGRASIAPIQWSGQAGTVALRVTAAKGGLRAGTVLQVAVGSMVTPAAVPGPPGSAPASAEVKPARKPIVLGAMAAPAAAGVPAPTPVDLQTPKYDPPAFWKSKWFIVAVAAGGAVAAGYAATQFRSVGTSLPPGQFIPGNINQVPVVIGPPVITVGKP